MLINNKCVNCEKKSICLTVSKNPNTVGCFIINTKRGRKPKSKKKKRDFGRKSD